MKIILFIALIFFQASSVVALEKATFDGLISSIQNKQFEEVEKFLENNKSTLKNDPEYYVILINYTFSKADQSHLVVAQGTPQEGDWALQDTKTGKNVGFMGPRSVFDGAIIKNCISSVNNALPNFEDRLDIHFGLVVLAEQSKDWTIIGNQLIQIIETSKRINNKWDWGSINSMTDEPKKFMLDNIQSRLTKMFYADTELADNAMIKVSESLIQHYPESIYGYANLGTYYFAKNDYEKAKEYYKAALNIDPDDSIVTANLKKINDMKKD